MYSCSPPSQKALKSRFISVLNWATTRSAILWPRIWILRLWIMTRRRKTRSITKSQSSLPRSLLSNTSFHLFSFPWYAQRTQYCWSIQTRPLARLPRRRHWIHGVHNPFIIIGTGPAKVRWADVSHLLGWELGSQQAVADAQKTVGASLSHWSDDQQLIHIFQSLRHRSITTTIYCVPIRSWWSLNQVLPYLENHLCGSI